VGQGEKKGPDRVLLTVIVEFKFMLSMYDDIEAILVTDEEVRDIRRQSA
jgi:hypothetical protein